MRRSALGLFGLLLGSVGLAGCGSEAPEPIVHPLHDLLACVPRPATEDDNENLAYLEYIDIRAAESAAGIEAPSSWAAFDESERDARKAWLRAVARLAAINTSFLGLFPEAAGTPDAVGFDAFDVDRVVAFGPGGHPSQILGGRFDVAKVVAAHERRGFAAEEVDGIEALLRRNDGKDDLAADLADRNPSSPFGGAVGRKPPTALLGSGLLASAGRLASATAIADTHARRAPSILGGVPYRAAVELLVQSAVAPELLVQAVFVRPSAFRIESADSWLRSALGRRASEAAVAAAKARYLGAGALPAYELAVLADGHVDGEQVALIALVHSGPGDAATAGAVLARRVEALSRLRAKQPKAFVQAVEGRVRTHRIEGSTGRHVLAIEVRYPVREEEPPGYLYRAWIRSILAREFVPLCRFAYD